MEAHPRGLMVWEGTVTMRRGDLEEMQIWGYHPRPAISGILRVRPAIYVLTSLW